MIDPNHVPDVELDEVVARYVLDKKLIFAKEKTAKPRLFYPYKHIALSVNRHRDCSNQEIWGFGFGVADFRGKTLHSRCDITVSDCTFDSLSVISKPIRNHPDGVPDNPNHADIVGYPDNREDQMSLAQKLASKARKRILPPDDSAA